MSRRPAPSWRMLARLVPVLAFIACSGDDPQVPSKLTPPSNTTLNGTVGSALSAAPTVTITDQKGRGVAGIWVHWAVTSGAGKVGNDSSQTNGTGLASSGGWTLGNLAGSQTMTASASNLPVATFTAVAAAGPVQTLLQWSAVQTAVVNTAVAVPPAVRAVDAFGNPIPGVAVQFTVTRGGGTLTGALQSTNANGVATAASWTMGTIAGDQTLLAVATNAGISTAVSAKAIGAAASNLVLVSNSAQNGYSGRRLCNSPVVRVQDQYGNGVAQVPVTFVPAASSGTVAGGSVVSDTGGVATPGGWTLGSLATQTLIATSAAVPGKQIVFTASVVPEPGYFICARFLGDGGTARQREAITKAVARWQSVIVGHVASRRLVRSANDCTAGIPAIDEQVDDLLLFVQLAAIDGPKNIIGQAAPCEIYLPSALTMMGFLQLDVADLDLMLSDGTLDNVVLHEIGHILGIGTLWNCTISSCGVSRTLLSGRGGSDPFFVGAAARDAFGLTGSPYAGTPVAVENCVGIPGCGAGTRDGHWRKSVFNTELMQGYAAPVMALSKVTIGSLADLGYQVNLSAADAFSLLPALRAGVLPDNGQEMVNDIANVRLRGVDANGASVLLRVPSTDIRR